ncbi:MAG: prepilin peptidase [Bacteroidia bacterium]|nr:prepilin peptidase [Bacteroidia bacterium]
MIFAFWIVTGLLAIYIFYQDMSSRLISTWALAVFTLVNTSRFLFENNISSLLINMGFTVGYFAICLFTIKVYYYIKTKSSNSSAGIFGWGDVWMCAAIGITLPPEHLVLFFTIGLTLSLVVHLLFFKKNNNVPLAGYLAIYYLLYSGVSGLNPL